MKVIDKGHRYLLSYLDADNASGELTFVKRIGQRYPRNDPPGYPGTTSQEVIRALIDRTQHVDSQHPHQSNHVALRLLRGALYEFEKRAAQIRGDESALEHAIAGGEIEKLPVCATCHHIGCTKH